jgi:hypothetical protein
MRPTSFDKTFEELANSSATRSGELAGEADGQPIGY